MTQEDIYRRTAEELGMETAHVKLVITNMFNTLIYYLRRPLTIGEKIQITSCFTVRFMPNRIDKDIKESEFRRSLSDKPAYIEQKNVRIAYLEKVKEAIKNFNFYKYYYAKQRQTEGQD